jgi:hypothetical protein
MAAVRKVPLTGFQREQARSLIATEPAGKSF